MQLKTDLNFLPLGERRSALRTPASIGKLDYLGNAIALGVTTAHELSQYQQFW